MEHDQTGYVIRSYVSSLAHGQKKLFWTSVVEYDHYPPTVLFAHTGLVHNPKNADSLFYKKLSYYTYKLMVEKLEGSDWDNIQTLIDGTDNVYAYEFKKLETGEPVYVAWWDWFDEPNYTEGDTKVISLDVGSLDSVKITQTVPGVESGAELDENEYPDFFASEIKQAANGTVTITLSENPVFMEKLSTITSVEEETGAFVPKDFKLDRKSTRLNSSHIPLYRMPSSA